jgi:hypothetical protein
MRRTASGNLPSPTEEENRMTANPEIDRRTRTPRIALPPTEAAISVGISSTELYRQIALGALRARKIGSRTVIEIDELHRWVGSLPLLDSTTARQTPRKRRIERAQETTK